MTRKEKFQLAYKYSQAGDMHLKENELIDAEKAYINSVEILASLKKISKGYVDTLEKLRSVQIALGKETEAGLTYLKFVKMREKYELSMKEIEEVCSRLKCKIPNDESQRNHDSELIMRYIEALDADWYPNDLLPEICRYFRKKKRLSFCIANPNHMKADILITGINPSVDAINDITLYRFIEAKHGIWNRIKKLSGNHIEHTAYLDLFPLKFSSQDDFERLFEDNIEMKAALLSITQEEIEKRIKPKLIIVANKGSHYYWGKDWADGKDNASIWMGYRMEKVKDPIKGLEGKTYDLRRIEGFVCEDGRINSEELEQTNLQGIFILFYAMYDERSMRKNSYLEAEHIEAIYNYVRHHLQPLPE